MKEQVLILKPGTGINRTNTLEVTRISADDKINLIVYGPEISFQNSIDHVSEYIKEQGITKVFIGGSSGFMADSLSLSLRAKNRDLTVISGTVERQILIDRRGK